MSAGEPSPANAGAPHPHRPLRGIVDALALRELLIEARRAAGGEFAWEPRRWEGTFWTVPAARLADPDWGAGTELWVGRGGRVVGAAVPDGPGDLAIQVHPDRRWLEDDILAWAEQHQARTEEGQRVLDTWAFDWDADRLQRLAERGYRPVADWGWEHRRRTLAEPVAVPPTPAGYEVRALDDSDADAQRWIGATNAVFGHSTPTECWRSFQGSPSYDGGLHIVVLAPDGVVAAFAALTVDTANRCATFEPVGTHPDHRRRGLAGLAMATAMARLQRRGTADVVHVANWAGAAAGRLYAAQGLVRYANQTAFRRVLDMPPAGAASG
jgi:mycothiol synthase